MSRADKNKKKVPFMRIAGRTTAMLMRAEGPMFTFILVFGALHSASWGIGTFVMQNFFDSIEQAVRGVSPAMTAYLMMAAVGGLTLLQQVFNSIHNFLTMQMMNKAEGSLQYELHKKAARVDPVAYESPDVLDDVEKARAGAKSAMSIVIMLTFTVCFYFVYFGIIGAYLYSLAPVLALTLPIIFVPSVLGVVARATIFTKLENFAAPARRKMEAHERAIGDRMFFKETRTLGAFSYFKRQYTETLALFNRENWKADRKTCLLQLGLKILTLCGYFGVLYILFTLLMNKTISLGAFGAVLGSLGMMISIMDEMVARNMGQIAGEVGKAANFIRFLDLPERAGTADVSGPANVVLKGASFRYPGADKDALTGIDLSIQAGETIAIVGENGAGKSTIVRLITGLYTPTSGSVKLRGVETKDAEPSALFHGVSAVMQSYQRYKLSLKQNVTVGDTASGEAIAPSAEKADLPLNGEIFPDGEETMLSREFDGVDLSGGQWQRVALARGFYRAHDMIVLDEPTAAIDPLEETSLYRKFAELSAGKTAVIVTHRLGSARIADRIVVMDHGKIAAIGTHDELLGQKGKYAEMFGAQAGWYKGTGVADAI